MGTYYHWKHPRSKLIKHDIIVELSESPKSPSHLTDLLGPCQAELDFLVGKGLIYYVNGKYSKTPEKTGPKFEGICREIKGNPLGPGKWFEVGSKTSQIKVNIQARDRERAIEIFLMKYSSTIAKNVKRKDFK